MTSATLTVPAPHASVPNIRIALSPVGTGTTSVFALDLGTATGWALRGRDSHIASGTVTFYTSHIEGAGTRYLRFQNWLDDISRLAGPIDRIVFEKVRPPGTETAQLYGRLRDTLTAWGERRAIPCEAVLVGTIKRFATGKADSNQSAVIIAMQGRGFHPGDDNEADALALLLWAIEGKGGRA